MVENGKTSPPKDYAPTVGIWGFLISIGIAIFACFLNSFSWQLLCWSVVIGIAVFSIALFFSNDKDNRVCGLGVLLIDLLIALVFTFIFHRIVSYWLFGIFGSLFLLYFLARGILKLGKKGTLLCAIATFFLIGTDAPPILTLFCWLIGTIAFTRDKKVNGNRLRWLWAFLVWFFPVGTVISLYATRKRDDSGSEKSVSADNAKNVPVVSVTTVTPEMIFTQDGKVKLTECISYIAQLKERYRFAATEWQPIGEQCETLLERLHDKTLYLGVLGEFSSGKSTFINAMLGEKLLTTKVTQGTTCAPTILRRGEKLSVQIKFSDGRPDQCFSAGSSLVSQPSLLKKIAQKFLSYSIEQSKFQPATPLEREEAMKFIEQYTANEEYAANVKVVEITLPEENLLFDSDVAIVDTPGLNSTNPRHNEITSIAVKDICDAALILVPISNPAPESLINYLKEYLADVQHHCVLVITKIDEKLINLDEDEREEYDDVLKSIPQRMESGTGAKFARIMSGSARYAVKNEKSQYFSQEEQEQFRIQFQQMLSSLKELLEASKKQVILEKILICIKNNLIPVLTALLQHKKEESETRRAALQENQLTNLSDFIAVEEKASLQELNDVLISQQDIEDALENLRQRFVTRMVSKIEAAENKDALKLVLSEKVISGVLKEYQKDVALNFNTLCKPIVSKLKELLAAFHQKFAEAYRRLEQISSFSENISIKSSNDNLNIHVEMEDFSSQIDSATIENTVKALGGAAAGAAVGALLGPLGAVAGGLLGGLVGWLFGPSLDDLKKKAIDAIEDISQDWKRQLRPSAQSHIESHREKSAKMLQNTLGGYVKKYQKQINHIIEKEKKQQQALLELAQAAEDDIECFKKIQYAVLKQLASNTANTNAEAEYRLLQTQE